MRAAQDGRLDRRAAARGTGAAGARVRPRPQARSAGLSERELEILLVLVHGASNREIAEQLRISPKTVGHHIQHIYGKAGVHSRAAATLWAVEHRLVRR